MHQNYYKNTPGTWECLSEIRCIKSRIGNTHCMHAVLVDPAIILSILTIHLHYVHLSPCYLWRFTTLNPSLIYEHLWPLQIPQLVLVTTIFLLIVIGNGCVLLSLVYSENGRKTRMNFFIMHLAIAGDEIVSQQTWITTMQWKSVNEIMFLLHLLPTGLHIF